MGQLHRGRGGATILKVGGQILLAERIIPKLCPLYALALNVGGHVPPAPIGAPPIASWPIQPNFWYGML